jgi:hypothetical protein
MVCGCRLMMCCLLTVMCSSHCCWCCRGVTQHRRSGRYEAHIWLKHFNKQVYLGE